MVIVFFARVHKFFSNEEVELKDEKLISKKYGDIHFKEMNTYRIKVSRGTTSLIITLYDGRKFSIGPQNSMKKEAIEEYFKFWEAFEEINSKFTDKNCPPPLARI